MRPADTDTTTSDRDITVVDGLPVEVWTVRPWSSDELAMKAGMIAPTVDTSALLDEINAATTVAKLRAAMVKVVEAMQ